mmetsp:Transcript_4429/g.6517  ORF Transcript_4429/g.6517 Transcript_4429/m.6517 type:complete len:268 (-) Transcript_4429:901-1704(-)
MLHVMRVDGGGYIIARAWMAPNQGLELLLLTDVGGVVCPSVVSNLLKVARQLGSTISLDGRIDVWRPGDSLVSNCRRCWVLQAAAQPTGAGRLGHSSSDGRRVVVCHRRNLLWVLNRIQVNLSSLVVRNLNLVLGSGLRRGSCSQRVDGRLLLLGLGRLLLLAKHVLQLVLVLLSKDSCSFLPLGNQVIGGSEVVELVLLEVGLALLDVEVVVLFEQIQNLRSNRNLIPAHNDAALLCGLHLVIPRMSSDVLDTESLSRIWVQYGLD